MLADHLINSHLVAVNLNDGVDITAEQRDALSECTPQQIRDARDEVAERYEEVLARIRDEIYRETTITLLDRTKA